MVVVEVGRRDKVSRVKGLVVVVVRVVHRVEWRRIKQRVRESKSLLADKYSTHSIRTIEHMLA